MRHSGSLKGRRWYDYLWLLTLLYFVLGFVNILFAWLGLICFFAPLLFALFGGDKLYCNRYCGRGQLFHILGKRLRLSRRRNIPVFLRKRWFRYAFLAFFMAMFFNMLLYSYFVFSGVSSLEERVSLLWALDIPWKEVPPGGWAPDWVVQFAFGFYGVMLTSIILGLLTMMLYKPRSWCVYCPMGTMTQMICEVKYRGSRSFKEDL